MALPADILAGLERRLRRHAGLELPSWVIEARAQARMAALGLDAASYLERVTSPRGGELDELVEAVRVGETRFFRHRAQVQAVIDVVVPAWRARGERAPRVWSAGCASGEEPYTLALVLAGALPAPASASILATDVSADALEVARRGRYPRTDLEQIPEPFQAGVVIADGELRIRPEVRRLVTFEQRNLADDDQPRGFDLVWCRNVLIYFAPAARQRVVERLVASLEPGGFLFVGYSEHLRDVPGLDAVTVGDCVIYRLRDAGAPPRAGSGGMTPLPGPLPGAPRSGASLSASPPPSPSPGPAPSPSPGPAPSPPTTALAPTHSVIPVHGHGDAAALTAAITAALRTPGLHRVTIDLDAAHHLGDDVAAVLRRARAAASAAGIALALRATRAGIQRWLRRHRLDEVAP